MKNCSYISIKFDRHLKFLLSMKKYFVEAVPEEKLSGTSEFEYVVYDNDEFIEVARILEPAWKSGFVLVHNGIRRECLTLKAALTIIDDDWRDFDLPDALFVFA